MSCDGCEPSPGPLATTPVVVGQPRQVEAQGAQAEAILALGGASPLDLTPEQMPGVHPAVLEMLNRLRSLNLELTAVVALLLQRGLITEQELVNARMGVHQAAQQAFHQAKQQLGRELAQRPTHLPAQPNSPRRGPST